MIIEEQSPWIKIFMAEEQYALVRKYYLSQKKIHKTIVLIEKRDP